MTGETGFSGRRRFQVLVALLGVVSLSGGLMAYRVHADQPHMQSALDALRTAERELSVADHDKGGHREKAIELVRKAIVQVEKGVGYDRKH